MSQKFGDSEDSSYTVITDEVTKACELAWNIVTLVPPAVIGCPSEYNEDIHEIRFRTGSGPYTLTTYYRPVLFHGSHGQLAEKGLISAESTTAPDCKIIIKVLRYTRIMTNLLIIIP